MPEGSPAKEHHADFAQPVGDALKRRDGLRRRQALQEHNRMRRALEDLGFLLRDVGEEPCAP
jgi:hypothetical protein